jgi:outer membrane immunogenic protein
MLRKLLLSTVAAMAMAGSALAADLPSRKAPPVAYVPPPAFTWTGFYLGVHGGYDWQDVRETGLFGGLAFYNYGWKASGPVGGGHAGFNWQVNQFVFGMEGDVDAVGVRSNTNGNPFFLPFFGFANNVNWRTQVGGSIRGRIGWAWDRVLLYGTGGVAFMNFRLTENFPGVLFGPGEVFNTTRTGLTVGGGLEYAFTNNWLARVEYRYSDFGTYNNASVFIPGFFYRERVRDNRVTAGISYKFDYAAPAPVVARY